MVFVTTGLGGGTGTGAAPIIASLATELDALTVAVATKPFQFEGRRRMQQAEQGLRELRECVDTVITIPNERLLHTVDRGVSLGDSFRVADDVLSQAVQGISDLITVPGLINLDLSINFRIENGSFFEPRRFSGISAARKQDSNLRRPFKMRKARIPRAFTVLKRRYSATSDWVASQGGFELRNGGCPP